jgi:2-succinyl-6-hydroxy-2,4-cyclohexadiene-1-carboxylate synthase
MGSAADWEAVSESLNAQYCCLAVDLPGHGGSTALSPESYTMGGAAQSVIEVLDALNIERATLVGYSMGGRIALYLALRYPERCSGLFLESASPGLEKPGEREARREADELKAKRLETEDFGKFLEDWYRQPLFASLASDEELRQRTVAERLRNDPVELAKSLRGMGTGSQPSLWDELPELRVPALAVAGELDKKFVGVGRRMEQSLTVDFTAVPNAGHNVRAESPEAYIGLLRDFLEPL